RPGPWCTLSSPRPLTTQRQLPALAGSSVGPGRSETTSCSSAAGPPCRSTASALHLDVALEERPLLHQQGRNLQLARDTGRGLQLQGPRGGHGAVDLAADDRGLD